MDSCFAGLREEAGVTDEPILRYFWAQGLVGTPTQRLHLRTLWGAALWLGLPPLLAQQLACLRQRTALHMLERWWARRLVRHLQIRLDIAGLEHIDPHERYIVTPLHEGFADILALLRLPLNLQFVARDELFGWRILGPYLQATGHICITPERGTTSYRHLLRASQRVFAAGESLVIFPQGTILGIETDFVRGAFALAHALQRPLLPIAITGSHRVWEHPYTARLRYGQRISMRVLEPISVDQLFDDGVEAVRVAIRRQLKTAALSGAMAPPRHFIPERDGFWDGYAYAIDPDFPELAAKIADRRRVYQQGYSL